METIKVRLVGIGPLLMHSNKGANPLSLEAKTIKPISSKNKKVDADYQAMARIEWESGFHPF